MIRSKPESCLGCVFHSHGSDFSEIEGTGANGILVVAEASGENEARDQLPLRPYAAAGGVHERILRRMGLSRQSFSTTNVLRCRPRNNWLEGNPHEFAAVTHCRPNLDRAIAERKPRVIVALGGIALRELSGLAGEGQGISHLAGYVVPLMRGRRQVRHECGDCKAAGYLQSGCLLCGGVGWWETEEPCADPMNPTPVIGNYHPAFLRRGKASYQGLYARIIQRALNITAGKDRSYAWNVQPGDPSTWPGLDYLLHPSRDEAVAFLQYVRENPKLPVAEDIETFESLSLDEDAREQFQDTQIRLMQFAIRKPDGGVRAMALRPEMFDIARDLLHTENIKYGHNWNLFDHKVIRAASRREGWEYKPVGPVFDTLDMFHHWQPELPAHLQAACSFVQFPFPWKHFAGTDTEFYGCVDVHADLLLGDMLVTTLKRDGLWGDDVRGYWGQVYRVRPVLSAMEDQGVPINDAARVKLGDEFDVAKAELDNWLDAQVGDECRGIDPKEGLKQFPKEVKERCLAAGLLFPKGPFMGFNEPDGMIAPVVAPHIVEPFTDKDGDSYYYKVRDFEVEGVGEKQEPTKRLVKRWCRVYRFNPNSRDQVFAYMDWKGHDRPKDKHREDEYGVNPDTSGAKELTRLANRTGDPFYLKVIESRGYGKLKGTYVEGFKPGADHKVHSTITFDTAIGQLSSRNPNIQNFPKLKPTVKLAKAMRAMIDATAIDPAFEISEWDYKSCHALTLGFLAEDPDYMRLTRLDVHSAVAGHMLELWNVRDILKESDEELRKRFKWLKSNPEWKLVRDDQAKHGILGIGNGLRPKGLHERYMENFTLGACPDCKLHGIRRACKLCKGTGVPSGLKVAERLFDILEGLFPKLFLYHESERRTAHERMQLISPFLHVRRFYEVYRWNSRKKNKTTGLLGDWDHGDQSEQAVSFRHPNIAFGHIRETLKAVHYSGLAAKWGMFNNVHDSLMFMYPSEMRAEHVADIAPMMRAPSVILKNKLCPTGLVIDIEASAGPNWRDLEEIKLPPCDLAPPLPVVIPLTGPVHPLIQ